MRRITPELTPDLYKHFGDPYKMSIGEAYKVATFRELVEFTAKLSYSK